MVVVARAVATEVAARRDRLGDAASGVTGCCGASFEAVTTTGPARGQQQTTRGAGGDGSGEVGEAARRPARGGGFDVARAAHLGGGEKGFDGGGDGAVGRRWLVVVAMVGVKVTVSAARGGEGGGDGGPAA